MWTSLKYIQNRELNYLAQWISDNNYKYKEVKKTTE